MGLDDFSPSEVGWADCLLPAVCLLAVGSFDLLEIFLSNTTSIYRAFADRRYNPPFPFRSGKMVGGSSGINSMAWVRPSRHELDIWSRLGVGSEWQWRTLLPYMMKTENVHLGNSSAFPGATKPSGFDSAVSGRAGPVQVSFDNTWTALRPPFVQSFINIGGVFNDDAVCTVFRMRTAEVLSSINSCSTSAHHRTTVITSVYSTVNTVSIRLLEIGRMPRLLILPPILHGETCLF